MTRQHPPAAVPALLLTAALIGGSAAPALADSNRLRMTGQGSPGTEVTGPAQIDVVGGTTVDIDVSTVSGGEAVIVNGPGDGLPRAVRFPAYVDSGSYPRAVLDVTPQSGGAFEPAAADFAFGAVFRLDAESSGRSEDDGDNLFQRGLHGDPAQFKLQIDNGRPSCTVRGSSGRVMVAAAGTVRRGTWYSVRCIRRDDQVTVKLAPYDRSEPATRRTSSGRTGTLSFSRSVPVSVGGKLTHDGRVVSGSSDQFNGRVAKVWIKRV